MAITYKDINLLSQKASVAGTEKLPVSDTEYITPSQIAGLVSVSGKADKVSSATNGDFAGLDSSGNLTDSGKKDSDFVHTSGNETIYGGKTFMGAIAIDDEDFKLTNLQLDGFAWIEDDIGFTVQDALDAKQPTLVSGTNIKTINNESILGSGNITVGGGGDTSSCVHKTGDETVGGDKTFTDNIGVVDADHIVYSGGGGGGFTKATQEIELASPSQSITFDNLAGEPKAWVCSLEIFGDSASGTYVVAVVGDSTGCHGIYTTGTQQNYSNGFTTSYANGSFIISAPSGVTFQSWNSLVYYYGSGTLTFKTSQIQPGSGVTAVTFTGTDLTGVPAMYAVMLETQVNVESYRRVSLFTNSAFDGDSGAAYNLARSFWTSNPSTDTTSSFSVSYNNGLYINSGGTNAGGYFHNPGTYVLYYLMASDVAGGGGGFQSLGDELDDIRDTIGDIATILASI